MSDHDESDPFGETRSAEHPLGPFEAFSAPAKEPVAPEPFPDPFATSVPGPYEAEPTAILMPEPGPAPGQNDYAAGYPPPPPPPPPPGYEYAEPVAPGDPGHGSGPGRGRLRSAVLFGGAAVLVVGLGAGVYAATQSSPGSPAAASPGTSASASPGSSKAAKGARAENLRLTVTAVSGDSFTGTTAGGATVSVRIAAGTKFGTAARPFTRAQLVPGAVVVARVRREAGGAIVATVIAAGTSDKTSGAASASPSTAA